MYSDDWLESTEPLTNQSRSDSSDRRKPGAPVRRLGNYLLLKVISTDGAMGVVYQARHEHLKIFQAVKVLKPDVLRSKHGLERFRREMAVVARLDHPNIVKAYDAGEAAGEHYLVMEFIDGVNLSEVMRQRQPAPLATGDACELVRQAALGLQHAHEHGLVHRDVKPSNLMLTRSGTVKLIDLGLARLEEREPGEDTLTALKHMVGTVDYMAPEQGLVGGTVDIRSDLYSLGCTLYKLLTGQAPFSGPEFSSPIQKLNAHAHRPAPPITDRRPDIPDDLARIVARLMAKKPDERIGTPAELADLIKPFCAGSELPKLAASCTAREADPIGFVQTDPMGFPQPLAIPTTISDPIENGSTERETGLGTTDDDNAATDAGSGSSPILKPFTLLGDEEFGSERGTKTRLREMIEECRRFCERMKSLEALLGLTALGIMALSLAGVLVYLVPTTSTVQTVSSETPTPGVWYPLLQKGQPRAVRWPDPPRNSSWHHNRDAENLLVHSENYSIISLGDSWDTRKYDFEINIQQTHWTSHIGIYFGWHAARQEDVDLGRYQTIQVQKDADRPGQFKLVRSFEMMIEPTKTIQRTEIASSPIPAPDLNEEHRLSITVGEHGLESVRWDGEPLPLLADSLTIPVGLSDADYRGRFGIIVDSTSGVFRKAGYLAYPESAQAPPKGRPNS